MNRAIRAELVKLTRRRFVAVTLVVTTLFATVVTAVVVLAAQPASAGRRAGPDQLLSVEALSSAGGGTAAFAQAASFGAVALLAVFIATVGGELSRGTFRTMLLQQPDRGRVLAGKLVAVVGFAAVLAVYAEAVAWVTARVLAPGQGIDTSAWTSIDAAGAALEDTGRLLVFIVGWATIATLVGVLTRSVPIGVGVGLVWAGPIENVVGDGWAPGERFFPGLVLRAVMNPDNAAISTSRALFTVSAYVVVAATIATVAVARRDVTS
jgi:ABC-type transport system involved in multi-copper enzyme maturation permease subunit